LGLRRVSNYANNIIKHLLEGKVSRQRKKRKTTIEMGLQHKSLDGEDLRRVYLYDSRQNCVEICGNQPSWGRRYMMLMMVVIMTMMILMMMITMMLMIMLMMMSSYADQQFSYCVK
jgi:hypothetical protein